MLEKIGGLAVFPQAIPVITAHKVASLKRARWDWSMPGPLVVVHPR